MSTQDAIKCLTKNIYETLDKNKPSIGVFIDLAKAFDTVDHSLLQSSLEDIGVRGTANDLFASYLTSRKQKVKIKQDLSSEQTIMCGVPQGTVLGPVLFIIYLNNLFLLEEDNKIISFADDTVIFYTAENWFELKQKAEVHLSEIKNWFDHRLLSRNFKKTLYVPFSSLDSSLPNFKLIVQNTIQIQPANQIKYLGIFIDSMLKWNVHIDFLEKKLRLILYRYKQISEILDIKQKIIVYQSIVEPHIRYGILGWGGVTRTHLNSLEILQRRFLRIILNREALCASDQLYKDTNILDCRQLFFLQACNTQFMTKHSLKTGTHKYGTRQREDIILPFMFKSIGQRSFNYLGPKVLNLFLKNTDNVNTKNLKKKFNKF